ncbi:hypothetical protein FQR65_LT00742 [Abscondita terminalis]|nr:hypothetical protein FQR65_LT00742 [Abscondita terminalis]
MDEVLVELADERATEVDKECIEAGNDSESSEDEYTEESDHKTDSEQSDEELDDEERDTLDLETSAEDDVPAWEPEDDIPLAELVTTAVEQHPDPGLTREDIEEWCNEADYQSLSDENFLDEFESDRCSATINENDEMLSYRNLLQQSSLTMRLRQLRNAYYGARRIQNRQAP